MMTKYIKLFLRLAVSTAMLSAVADRFGLAMFTSMGLKATLDFSVCLLLGFRTEWVAKLSGALIACFGLAMFTSVGLKATFDYSVWNAVGACLAISCLKEKHWEIDSVIK